MSVQPFNESRGSYVPPANVQPPPKPQKPTPGGHAAMSATPKMSERPTPETDAVRAYEGNWDTKALRMTAHARKLERERDEAFELLASEKITRNHIIKRSVEVEQEREEARVLLRILAGLVAYGLGQSGEEWSLEAMRQATNAIQNVKFLEEAK